MEYGSSLSCSQERTTWASPEPAESNQHCHRHTEGSISVKRKTSVHIIFMNVSMRFKHRKKLFLYWNLYPFCIAQPFKWLRAYWTAGASFPPRGGIFSFTTISRSTVGHKFPTQCEKETIPLGGKWPKPEADDSSPCCAQVKNVFLHTFTTWCLGTGTTFLLKPMNFKECFKGTNIYTEETCKFIIVFTRTGQNPRTSITLRNMLGFLQWGFISPTPNPQAGGSPFIGCLFNYSQLSSISGESSLHPQTEELP
jgi:hypothetical protein